MFLHRVLRGWKGATATAVTCSLVLTGVGLAQAQDADCSVGSWSAPFMHEFATTLGTDPFQNRTSVAWPHATPTWQPMGMWHAVHVALIPKGPHQGRVLMWDHQFPGNVVQPYQRWAILDPSPTATTRFYNFFLPMPTGGGDLFCAGHAWTPNGDLFVAGGTIVYPIQGLQSGVLVYLFDPSRANTYYNAFGEWTLQSGQPLTIPRWYPTVTLIHQFPEPGTQIPKHGVLVTGGTEGNASPDRGYATYEAYFVNMPASAGQPSTVVRDTTQQPELVRRSV